MTDSPTAKARQAGRPLSEHELVQRLGLGRCRERVLLRGVGLPADDRLRVPAVAGGDSHGP